MAERSKRPKSRRQEDQRRRNIRARQFDKQKMRRQLLRTERRARKYAGAVPGENFSAQTVTLDWEETTQWQEIAERHEDNGEDAWWDLGQYDGDWWDYYVRSSRNSRRVKEYEFRSRYAFTRCEKPDEIE